MCFVAAWRCSVTVQKPADTGCVWQQVTSASHLCWWICTAEKFECQQQQAE